MLSQHGITCVLCLTVVSTQQCYCVCFYRFISESDKLLIEKNLLCENVAEDFGSGAESSSHECLPRHPSAAGSRRQTLGKGHPWIFQYDPKTKRQSRQWKSVSSPRPKKACMQQMQVKVMLITFFDHHRMVHHKFVP